MKETLEGLWNGFVAEACARIRTEEERALVKTAAELRKRAAETLTEEQSEVIERYVEALYDTQGFFAKKAFFAGCEFATSFLLEAGCFGK